MIYLIKLKINYYIYYKNVKKIIKKLLLFLFSLDNHILYFLKLLFKNI